MRQTSNRNSIIEKGMEQYFNEQEQQMQKLKQRKYNENGTFDLLNDKSQ